MNSRPMVAGLESYLAAEAVDVPKEVARGSLVAASEREHLVTEIFDVSGMHPGTCPAATA